MIGGAPSGTRVTAETELPAWSQSADVEASGHRIGIWPWMGGRASGRSPRPWRTTSIRAGPSGDQPAGRWAGSNESDDARNFADRVAASLHARIGSGTESRRYDVTHREFGSTSDPGSVV
jgi:hypothetical protein